MEEAQVVDTYFMVSIQWWDDDEFESQEMLLTEAFVW